LDLTKKLVILCLILVTVMVIPACGADSTQTSESNTEDKNTSNMDSDSTSELTENWPEKDITIIVGFDAGGGMDVMSRTFAPVLSEQLGVSVIVENRPGAGSGIAAEYVMDQPADGYTLFAASSATATFPALANADVTYHDLEMIAIPFMAAQTFLVPSDSPFQDMNDLIEAWKSGGTTASNTGIGGISHMPQAIAVDSVNGNVTYVPYESGGESALAIVRGDVDWGTADAAIEAAEFIKQGNLKPLAIFSDEPYQLPDYGEIPPITDFIPELEDRIVAGAGWRGFAVKKGTPEHIVDRLTNAIKSAFESDKVQDFVTQTGAVTGNLYGEEAQKAYEITSRVGSWILYDSGEANRSPEEVNVPRP
jgi:tripartite-type tricarboxylate transporter receptor subunit TctC